MLKQHHRQPFTHKNNLRFNLHNNNYNYNLRTQVKLKISLHHHWIVGSHIYLPIPCMPDTPHDEVPHLIVIIYCSFNFDTNPPPYYCTRAARTIKIW